VSWYHHAIERGPQLAGRDPGDAKRMNWQELFAGGRSSFKETVTRACEGRLEHAFTKAMQRRDTDLYTEYVRRLAGRAIKRGSLEAGPFEELVPFFVDFLDRHALLTGPPSRRGRGVAASEPAEHAHYRTYYDDELQELVAHKARWVIERFGYAF
jgi:hypothetical protein